MAKGFKDFFFFFAHRSPDNFLYAFHKIFTTLYLIN